MSKKDDALKLALESLEDARTFTGAWPAGAKAITAIREALAEQPAQQDMPKIGCVNHDCEQCKAQQEPVRVPVTDNTYNYAKSLAEAIFKQHFASDEHYSSGRIVWGVNDTVIGILTQIDNMVADMVRRPAQRKPLTDEDILRTKGQFKGTLDVQFDKFAYAIEAKLKEKNGF